MAAVTASDLRDGEVVFWAEGRWVKRFADAELFNAVEPGQAALDLARAQPTIVVEPYLINLDLEGGVPVPTSYRERVRALGPTIHPEMGKQAEGGLVVQALRAHAGGARSSGRLGLIRLKR
ncbi:DUF2849 domain-containing protein [Caulobacter sp. S45]|uniref:DUF2849 domain-containing protein n=1 Tax=Caulobacter sp. S45 TaxID=1641861 RepID=UPI0015767335|nr:DUF2849 domain-containing protein [Caulobacter sp. S45]